MHLHECMRLWRNSYIRHEQMKADIRIPVYKETTFFFYLLSDTYIRLTFSCLGSARITKVVFISTISE